MSHTAKSLDSVVENVKNSDLINGSESQKEDILPSPAPLHLTNKLDNVDLEKLLRRAIHEFNSDPVKGMRNLMLFGGVSEDPVAVSRFLLTESGLSKAKIGEYLGTG